MAARLLGRVTRMQVQLSPLKPGANPRRRYDPAPLRVVTALRVGPDGVIGIGPAGETHLDVHHTTHPLTRDRRGRGGVSFMGSVDYRRLRARFGDHLADGQAGETLLIDTDESLVGAEFPAGVRVQTADGGWLDLAGVRVAEPCVEFTFFCLDREPGEVDDEVGAAMEFLGRGGRGFRAAAAGRATITPGAEVWANAPAGLRCTEQLTAIG